MARNRAGAGPGHGRLGAALRVVAALLRAGEPAPHPHPRCPQLPAPRACCTCAQRRWGRVAARARRACNGSAHTCVPPARRVPLALTPRGRALHSNPPPSRTVQPESFLLEESGLGRGGRTLLRLFTNGETEAWRDLETGQEARGRGTQFVYGLPLPWAQPDWVVVANGSGGVGQRKGVCGPT